MDVYRIPSRIINATLAVVVWRSGKPGPAGGRGTTFLTPDDFPQQVGVLRRLAGESVAPHAHRPKTYPAATVPTQETIVVTRGRVEVDLFDVDYSPATTLGLSPGDVIVLMNGGHGLRYVEDATIIEVKQGPYEGRDADKFDIPAKEAT